VPLVLVSLLRIKCSSVAESENYDAMNNPKLLQYFEDQGIILSPTLHNELAVFRGVKYDPQSDIAHDKAVAILRARDSRKQVTRSFAISIASLLIAVIALVVALLK
jgi:hypothetical protein